jgi:hypothetical protein
MSTMTYLTAPCMWTDSQHFDLSALPYPPDMPTMETIKSNHASPQAHGDAINALVYRTKNSVERRRIATTPRAVAGDDFPEPPMERHKINHPLQQEAEQEVIGEAPLTFANFSLAHQGRFSEISYIRQVTWEPDHDTTLTTIMYEAEGAFVCRIEMRISNTAEICTGFCKVPVAEMHSDISRYYRLRPSNMDEFVIGDFFRFRNLAGKVRLGAVIGEDHCPGTYTCKAEFGIFGAREPHDAEVYVPKRHVPNYKTVDWEGEHDAVPSIETGGGEEIKDRGEEQTARRHTVEFSRRIEASHEEMPATFRSVGGEDYIENAQTQIIAYEFKDEHIYLEFRVRKCEASWYHLYGHMHRELNHGRFHILPSPISNVQSDAQFDMSPMDPAIADAMSRRYHALRALM